MSHSRSASSSGSGSYSDDESSTESTLSRSESESSSEDTIVDADENLVDHVGQQIGRYKHYTRYLKSKIPMMQHAKVQNTAEINRLLEEKKRLQRDLKSYRYQLDSADPSKAVQKSLVAVDRCLKDLKAINTKPASGIMCFSTEFKVIQATSPDELQDEMIKKLREYLGADASQPAELRSISDMHENNFSKDDFFKPNSARVCLTVVGTTRVGSVQRMRGNVFVNELYGLERFSLPGPLALFDKFRSPNSDLDQWAIAEIENYRSANPTQDDGIALSGNIPPLCVKALMDYCKLKGYECVNLTGVKVSASKKRVAALEDKLNTRREKLVGINTALAYSDDAVKKLEKKTTFSP